MSWYVTPLGVAAFLTVVTLALSLAVGGWLWPAVTALMLVTWQFATLILRAGDGQPASKP
jgi:hypothetical protein